MRILTLADKTRRTLNVFNPLSIFTRIKTSIMTSHLKFINFWRTLNLAQRCYFIATSLAFLLMFNLEQQEAENSASSLFLISLLFAVSGLLIEFWPKFITIWHSLLGKTIIVIFYGIMANFALASAAGLVNDVAGVSSSVLPYSHNMALILNIPTWFILTSAMALVVIQLSVPFYLVLLLLLKPFGLHGIWHKKEYRFVFTTAMVRYIWCTVLLVATVLFSVNSGLINQSTPLLGASVGGFIESNKQAATQPPAIKQSEIKGSEVLTEVATSQSEDSTDSMFNVNFGSNLESDEMSQHIYNKSMAAELMLKKLLADFIYQYEADSYSRCRHPENTKVIELNDYQLLLIKQAPSEVLGYSYEVVACQSPGISHG